MEKTETILVILCMAVLTNILGLIFGNALNGIANFFQERTLECRYARPKTSFWNFKTNML